MAILFILPGTHDAGSLQATTTSIPNWQGECLLYAVEELSYSFANLTEWLLQHQADITELANLSVLVPVMNKHRLLTHQENSYLTSANTTPQERCQKLVEFLLRKGEDGYRRFLQSLKEEQQHIGHVQLYNRLLSPPPPPPPPPPPQSATFSQSEFAYYFILVVSLSEPHTTAHTTNNCMLHAIHGW